MNAHRQSYWHWPGWGQLGYAIGLGTAQGLLFLVVYGGASWFTSQHAYRVRLNLDFERGIPLVPLMAVFYLSLNVLMWLAPFILRTRRELTALVASATVATCAAGVAFVLLPAADAYPVPKVEDLGRCQSVFRFARWLAMKHNYFPSLHVAYTWIFVTVLARGAPLTAKCLWWLWGGLIVASTLLTHQHYLVDVITGVLLGLACMHWVYRPLTRLVLLSESPTTVATLSMNPAPPV